MTPAQKTVAILGLAGTVVAGTTLLTSPAASSVGTVAIATGPTRSVGTPKSGHAEAHGFTLDAELESSHVLSGQSETHMAITLSSDAAGRRKRPAVDIALVLDRSGSMAGDKLEQARLAADRLLAQLEQSDRFPIIAYGTDVDVIAPLTTATESNVRNAQRALLQIRDDGGTNLSGGLIAARDQLSRFADDSGVERVERVVLISDGLANEGIIGSDALAQLAEETANAGVSLTTVGVGLDYDEQVMTRMAVSGHGNYYFVESAGNLRAMFAKELGDLGNTTATQVSLILEPKPGVEIVEAYGYDLRAIGSDGRFQIPIADLHAGDTRKVVVRLRTQLGAGDEAVAIASAAVSLRATDDGKLVGLEAGPTAIATANADEVESHRQPSATTHIERAKTAAAIVEATALYEQGQQKEAKKVLSKRRHEARSVAASIADDGLEQELKGAADVAEKNFDEAPAAESAGGKRARKANRYDAFKLAH